MNKEKEKTRYLGYLGDFFESYWLIILIYTGFVRYIITSLTSKIYSSISTPEGIGSLIGGLFASTVFLGTICFIFSKLFSKSFKLLKKTKEYIAKRTKKEKTNIRDYSQHENNKVLDFILNSILFGVPTVLVLIFIYSILSN